MSIIIKIINIILISNIIYKISIKENTKYINTIYFYLIIISSIISFALPNTNEINIISLITILLTKIIIDLIIDIKIVKEKEIILIKNGILNIKELIKNKNYIKKLSSKLKEKNINNIKDVDFAILEKTGEISIYFNCQNNTIPITLISNGNINYNILKKINKNDKWLLNSLENKKIKTSEVLLAILSNKSLYIIKK